jgi:hypothetical protein
MYVLTIIKLKNIVAMSSHVVHDIVECYDYLSYLNDVTEEEFRKDLEEHGEFETRSDDEIINVKEVSNFDSPISKYKPIVNPLKLNISTITKYIFDATLDIVKIVDKSKVWTVVEEDDGLYVKGGYYKTTIGYIITEKPFENKTIKIDDRDNISWV